MRFLLDSKPGEANSMAGLTEHGEKSGFEGVNPVRDRADRVGFVEGGSSPSGGGTEKTQREEEEEAIHGLDQFNE